MAMTQIFNPLLHRAPTINVAVANARVEGVQTATAAIYNEKIGECPKCKARMGTAIIANADAMYFCEKCRVTVPLRDEELPASAVDAQL